MRRKGKGGGWEGEEGRRGRGREGREREGRKGKRKGKKGSDENLGQDKRKEEPILSSLYCHHFSMPQQAAANILTYHCFQEERSTHGI